MGLVALGAAMALLAVALLVWHPTLAAEDEPVNTVESDQLLVFAKVGQVVIGAGQR